MQKLEKYTIFPTKWGYFGLAGTETTLCRTCLPDRKKEAIKARLIENGSEPKFDSGYFKNLQDQIVSYYEETHVDFDPEIPISLDGFRPFSTLVLTMCRELKFGQTMSYSALAGKSGQPSAGRAAGSALARNPMPLIIPCHRVFRTDGGLGGFTTPGGVEVKKKMLELERQALD